MSTRSVLIIHTPRLGTEKDILIYHHWDGYPEGVGATLKGVIKKYQENKYVPYIDCTVLANALIKDPDECWELTVFNHTDIEYLYLINCDNKQLHCYRVNQPWKNYQDIIKSENEVSLENVGE